MSCNKVLLIADDEKGFQPLGNCHSRLKYSMRQELVLNIDMLDREIVANNELIVLNVHALSALHIKV